MSVTLARVPLTLTAALAFHVSMSPPSTSEIGTPKDRCAVRSTARFITSVLTKGLFWASALMDTFVVLAPHIHAASSPLPPNSISPAGTLLACVRHPAHWAPGLGLALRNLSTSLSLPLAILPPLPPVTVAGTTLALTGAYLRYAAYRALGQFYACPNLGLGPCVSHSIQAHAHGHAHALITTGPYTFVRHPGYAGLLLCTAGLVVLQFDALKNGLGLSVGMRAVALVCAILATVGALRRIQEEERSLRARFKGEWERWAKRVRYRLIPGVY